MRSTLTRFGWVAVVACAALLVACGLCAEPVDFGVDHIGRADHLVRTVGTPASPLSMAGRASAQSRPASAADGAGRDPHRCATTGGGTCGGRPVEAVTAHAAGSHEVPLRI